MTIHRRVFVDWSEAFDYCREADRPIIVEISGDGEFKLYPSGKAVRRTTAVPDAAEQQDFNGFMEPQIDTPFDGYP